MSTRFAVAGLSWWGLGPEDIALQMSHAGASCDSLILWNIRRRLDRLMMESPWAKIEASRRLKRFLEPNDDYRAVFVASPHRFSAEMLRSLKSKTTELIAILGDTPVGARAVESKCWRLFDQILVADEAWLDRIPETGAIRGTMPWGSTLVNADLLNADSYTPESVVLVGSPYPERIELAQLLAREEPLVLQGNGWPELPGVILRPASSRIATLEQVRENRELVVNVHHKQFDRGLNPQFFDFAAAGIPQVVVHANDLHTYRLGLGVNSLEGSLDGARLLSNPSIRRMNIETISKVRNSYMFHSCVGRFVN